MRPFAELHACSSYSFLEGAASPESMVRRASELELEAIALLDRDGFYGAMKCAEAAREEGVATVFGAELSLPEGRLPVLCRGVEGYRLLSHLITDARMRAGVKGEVIYPPLEEIAHYGQGKWVFLLGYQWADRMDEFVSVFGIDNVVREFAVTMSPEDSDHHEELLRWNNMRGIVTAYPGVDCRGKSGLAHAKRSLSRLLTTQKADPFVHPMGAPWLRSGEQLAQMAPHIQDFLETTCEVARECAFTFDLVKPELPQFPVPKEHTEMTWLRHLTQERAQRRYAHRSESVWLQAQQQIEHELEVIEQLNFPGYFLIVTDIVDFCAKHNIFCQGRGSAANSVVCFSLGITNAEPISAKLLFERFLSPYRDGPPDIDVDIENTRREEVIQYVYQRYGRDNAAQVANVITYRRKGALRDAARALGYPEGMGDVGEYPDEVVELAAQLQGQPRHLGIHSGGMVICDRPLADVVPTEWARKSGRSVIQWDKEDAAAAHLVKFDLLGLGMLGALHHMVDMVYQSRGIHVDLWELDLSEPEIYQMLSRGDAVGVFQVESRAQLATLPRLKPQVFFDLVVEVALIRPGPIQGGSVHPYLRRRCGEEPVTYEVPVLKKSLEKTLGIPLFQEQLMQIAVDAAGFSGGEADQLRRAMGAKRSEEKIERLKKRFYRGLEQTSGLVGEAADTLWNKIASFATYGFPESHSQSFAALVYFSAWFKYHYPAEFYVGLLRAQPMGFYSPQSLIQDARRHGIRILPISVNHSQREATVVKFSSEMASAGNTELSAGNEMTEDTQEFGIRLGLNMVAGLGDDACDRIVAAAPFRSVRELSRCAGLTVKQIENLALAGALSDLSVSRREALWQAGIRETQGMLPDTSAVVAPALPGMSALELIAADISTTGVTHNLQPMELLRAQLDERGVITAAQLAEVEDGTRVKVAGIVTHRQRPATASGLVFLGMEDETGLINVVVSRGLWKVQGDVLARAKALVIRGIVQNASEATSLVADLCEPLQLGNLLSRGSRDFR